MIGDLKTPLLPTLDMKDLVARYTANQNTLTFQEENTTSQIAKNSQDETDTNCTMIFDMTVSASKTREMQPIH